VIAVLEKTARKIWQGERGGILPLVAVASLVLVLAAGLLLDYGRMVVYRTQLQAFCEAAAHAGAREADVLQYPGSNPPIWTAKLRQDDARREALACLDENLATVGLDANGLTVLSKTVTFPADDQIRVEVEVEGKTFLVRVLGGQYRQVTFKATGEAYARAAGP
jgi:Flp pilus assembly protein TadG